MNRILIILSLVYACSTASIAQGKGHGENSEMRERIEAQKISFITQQLDLSPEEAQLFWPVYNELEKKKKENRYQSKVLFKKLRNNGEQLSDTEMGTISDQLIELKVQEANLQKEYHFKYKKILPAHKILTLYHAEKQFQGILLRQIKERGGHQHGKEN
ncbi:hypothetical protein [Labilibaculum sp.]|uniref:hypothetical protein n=1 Tax=Labilibaculum sp. TaxID=2060723 RepID=UPI0035666DBA